MEFKGTKGRWYVSGGDKYATIQSENIDEKIVVTYPTIATVNSTFIDIEEFRANALLIAEAGNIRQQIPFSLTELKRQRDEMLEMLEEILDSVDWSDNVWVNSQGRYIENKIKLLDIVRKKIESNG
jgi:hypothetical protein